MMGRIRNITNRAIYGLGSIIAGDDRACVHLVLGAMTSLTSYTFPYVTTPLAVFALVNAPWIMAIPMSIIAVDSLFGFGSIPPLIAISVIAVLPALWQAMSLTTNYEIDLNIRRAAIVQILAIPVLSGAYGRPDLGIAVLAVAIATNRLVGIIRIQDICEISIPQEHNKNVPVDRAALLMWWPDGRDPTFLPMIPHDDRSIPMVVVTRSGSGFVITDERIPDNGSWYVALYSFDMMNVKLVEISGYRIVVGSCGTIKTSRIRPMSVIAVKNNNSRQTPTSFIANIVLGDEDVRRSREIRVMSDDDVSETITRHLRCLGIPIDEPIDRPHWAHERVAEAIMKPDRIIRVHEPSSVMPFLASLMAVVAGYAGIIAMDVVMAIVLASHLYVTGSDAAKAVRDRPQ